MVTKFIFVLCSFSFSKSVSIGGMALGHSKENTVRRISMIGTPLAAVASEAAEAATAAAAAAGWVVVVSCMVGEEEELGFGTVFFPFLFLREFAF